MTSDVGKAYCFVSYLLISCKNNHKVILIKWFINRIRLWKELDFVLNAQVNTCFVKVDRFIYKFRGFVNGVSMRIRREIVKCFYSDRCFAENILI